MNRRASPLFRLFFRSLATKNQNHKFDFDLDVDVANGLKNGSLKARHHPGSFRIKPVSLPEPLIQAVETIVKAYPWKSLSRDAQSLNQYIWSRHTATEDGEYKHKLKEVEERIRSRSSVDPLAPEIPEKERKRLLDSLESKVHWWMKKEVYNWKAIDYDPYKSAMYLAVRLAPDFAALVKIMAEMKQRDPDFAPLTMLDFGSGVGSGMWAVDQVWPGLCREAVCVDRSADMNDMADKLLRGGDPDNPRLVRPGGTFFKQFLPQSRLLKYDLVISSRSLFELPDITSRLKTLDVLWRKTSGYLVIVEAGTNAGYRVVQEARDYVLELSRLATEKGEAHPEGYVFAPCPHDKFCPKFFDGTNVPCNFEVSYKPASFEKDQTAHIDRYTYIVLKRGKRGESNEKNWPRLVEAPLIRKKHTICRMCTHSGTLRELTATKRKHSKECYGLLRASKWGDLLPVQMSEVPESECVDTPSDGELSEPEESVQN